MLSTWQRHLNDYPFHKLNDAIYILWLFNQIEKSLCVDKLLFYDHGLLTIIRTYGARLIIPI